MAVRRIGTFRSRYTLDERKRLVLEGTGRTRWGRYGQGGNKQNIEPEVLRNEAGHFPAKKHVLREAALIFRAKSGERWRI